MAKCTVRVIMHEALWLAPELTMNEKFLNEWANKKWGVKSIDELLIPESDLEETDDSKR